MTDSIDIIISYSNPSRRRWRRSSSSPVHFGFHGRGRAMRVRPKEYGDDEDDLNQDSYSRLDFYQEFEFYNKNVNQTGREAFSKIMLRITALNDEESRTSEDNIIHPKEPSQEVQEENALKVYNEALQDQRNGNVDKAESVYRQLLESKLLLKVNPEKDSQKVKKSDNICSLYAKPSLMLKYSCLKNLAAISQERNNLDEALSYYTQALDIEGTDVSVWYKAGLIAMKLSYIHVAVDFFCKGLEFSPKHWLCLDNVITCLFVFGNYVNCLYYISSAFALDCNYTRGHVVRDQIFLEQPSLAEDINEFFPKINLYMNKKIEVKEEIKEKMRKDLLALRVKYCEKMQSQNKSTWEKPEEFRPSKSLETRTWSALGEYILNVHTEVSEENKNVGFLSLISLKEALSKKEEGNQNNGGNDSKADNPSSEDVAKEKQKDHASSKEHNEEGEKKSKKSRGSALMEELLWGGKRRSARVRSSLRGNPEPMDVAEALRRILPRKLLHKTRQTKSGQLNHKGLEEDSMDTMDLYRLFERQESAEERRQKEERERSEVEHDIDKIVESEGYFGSKTEEADIVSFLESNDNKTIIDLIKSYVLILETHWNKTWPSALPSVYIRCFQLMRKHHQPNFRMCSEESEFRELAVEAGSVLLYGELCLEHTSSNRNLNQNTPKLETNLDITFLQNAMELIERNYAFESDEKYFEFLVRLYWLRCHWFLVKGQTSLAIATLNELLACYDLFPGCSSTVINLKNNRKNNVISRPIVEEFLIYQSRKRSLAEVVRLYEDASYEELTEILKETFNSAQDDVGNQFKEQENELVSRQTQLSMLINGLYHLNEYKECLYWLETCCYELLQKAPPSSFYNFQEPEEESWMIVLDRFLIAVEDCLTLGNLTLDEALPHPRLSRFVQTICRAICKELEDSDRPPCPARPWIILNKILIGMEKNEKREKTPPENDEDEDENDIPSSVLILFTAHEYLGRREWCNCNESVLLYLIMDQVIPNIRSTEWSPFRETIQQHLEQVVYCLYSHPSKKAKARYLTEHNVTSIPLTWKRGIQLFDLFRPDETPSYDSLRINLIGSETEVLFRRIAALIPDESDPVQNSEKMMDFIMGRRNDVPEAIVKLPEMVQDLFYILGDYYFKTHESAKAVNYLLIDLCANPDRVDSWASMALSRASILEQQLNSCDPIKDEVFLQDALSALRCYEHCLQLDSSQCALWIEYGTFVYTIHSFCSQRMKLESLSLGIEKFEELETTKNKMLDTAKQAFLNANLIWYEFKEESERQDERWLHHYMLGKISEKHGDLNYFDHYEKAAQLLYENDAEYPSKIGYTTPQTLAIEALEVYYRIHVCVIKTLELNEGKPLDPKTKHIFNKYLELVGKGHFVKQMSKSELAKTKAKEAEIAAQNAKPLKVIKDLMDEMISKIEADEEEERRTVVEVPMDIGSECVIEFVRGKSDSEIVQELEEIQDEQNCRRQSVDEKLLESKKSSDENGELVVLKTGPERSKSVEGSVTIKQVRPAKEIQPRSGSSYEYRENQECDSRYFITLDDFKNQPQPGSGPPKKKRRASRISASSSSCGSEEIKYDDDTSSSPSTAETSECSPSSCNSSKESGHAGQTNKQDKVEGEGKNKANTGTQDTQGTTGTQGTQGTTGTQGTQGTTGTQGTQGTAGTQGTQDTTGTQGTPGTLQGSETPEKPDNTDIPSPVPDKTEDDMLNRCLLALETCAIRFPQHYKSVYRLAHFYFRSKKHRNLSKCKDLLLGRYLTPNGTITGLFADRKTTNFFNGIWRIPAGDVDRPGSFASHMSRSVLLLMEVLRDLNDHKMLLELCLQLRKVPEPDKKYLREDERNQLSVQAINLSVKTLRKNVREATVMTLPMVLDSYRCYQKVQKHYPNRESIFGDILLDAFKRLGKGDRCTLDQAIKFCQSEISATKNKIPRNTNVNSSVTAKPKQPKMKKEEKKKATPKPQITAKAVVKQSKSKKTVDCKKRPMNITYNDILSNPACFSAAMNNSMPINAVEALRKMSTSGAQSYTDILKNVCQTNRAEKKTPAAEHTPMANIFDQMNMDFSHKVIMEHMKLMSNPSLYHYQNYSMDYGGDLFKQYNSVYNSALMGNYLSHLQECKKPKIRKPNPRTVLKSEIAAAAAMPSATPLLMVPEGKKTKTNFNIDDILGKPSTSTSKPRSPNVLTPSQLNMSIEDKIKNAFNDLDNPKEQFEAINLSPNRKKIAQLKRNAPDGDRDEANFQKKSYRPPNFSAVEKGDIEVVIIDD